VNHHQATKGNEDQTIPTVVNDVICANNNKTPGLKYNDSINDRINTPSQSINKRNSDIIALSGRKLFLCHGSGSDLQLRLRAA
jgi:hypothetical protein